MWSTGEILHMVQLGILYLFCKNKTVLKIMMKNKPCVYIFISRYMIIMITRLYCLNCVLKFFLLHTIFITQSRIKVYVQSFSQHFGFITPAVFTSMIINSFYQRPNKLVFVSVLLFTCSALNEQWLI